MADLAAGLVAAGVAWLGNSFVVRKWGDKGVVWIIPVWEEIIKTSGALLIGASVPLTHGVFGLVEAVHDSVASRRLGLWAGLASVVSHLLFGETTYYVFRMTGVWISGVTAAALLHIYLNFMVTRLCAYLSRCHTKRTGPD